MFEIIIQYGDTSASQGNQFQHLNILLLKIVFICLNVISYILIPSSLAWTTCSGMNDFLFHLEKMHLSDLQNIIKSWAEHFLCSCP